MIISLNKPIPAFEAICTGKKKFSTKNINSKLLVLYFYPKDNTPACTNEALSFRDRFDAFNELETQIYGISRDNLKSHEEFKNRLNLPFDLIADNEEKLCHMFGVVKNKIMYGKKVKGIERSTFLINKNGILLQEWRGVKVEGHAQEVLMSILDKYQSEEAMLSIASICD